MRLGEVRVERQDVAELRLRVGVALLLERFLGTAVMLLDRLAARQERG
jgi:hypothetical protein